MRMRNTASDCCWSKRRKHFLQYCVNQQKLVISYEVLLPVSSSILQQLVGTPYASIGTPYLHTSFLTISVKLGIWGVLRRSTVLTWWPAIRRSDEHSTETRGDIYAHMHRDSRHGLNTGQGNQHSSSLQKDARAHSQWPIQTRWIIQNNIYTTHFSCFNCE